MGCKLHCLIAITALSLSLPPAAAEGQDERQGQTPKESAAEMIPPASTLPPPPDLQEARPIPFEASLMPADPPKSAVPPPRPLPPSDLQTLDVLYKRPSPMGPKPIPRDPPAAILVVGKGPLFWQLPGKPAFAEKYPPELLEAEGGMSMFSDDNNVELPKGEVQFASFDRTLNDSKLSQDSMAFEASITDHEGNVWDIVQTRVAPVTPDPVGDPWYGSLAIDTLEHGDTHRGHPGEAKTLCAMCSWGWADVWKNGRRVATSAPLHVMLSSDAHDEANGFKYYGYDVSDRPIREVHVVIDPSANLPAPGGYLHVMFENAEVTRGTPDEIAKKAAGRFPSFPDVVINAVPHLQWSETAVEVPVGRRVRLILNNMDPSSFHAFKIRSPEGDVLVPLEQGSQWTTTLAFDQPGEYEFWCPVSNHRNRGMYGRILAGESVPGGTEGPPGEGK